MKIIQESKKNIKEIITSLKNGSVLILPTDTVYGLVCDAANKGAVEKIFEIKKRDKLKSLPVFVKDIEMAKDYALINSEQEKFLDENWPGPVTVILKSKIGLSPLVYKDGTIALRQSSSKLIGEVIKHFKKPLAQTSVNISGQPFLTKSKEIIDIFSNTPVKPDLIVDAGDLIKSKPSTIIDLANNIKIIRY